MAENNKEIKEEQPKEEPKEASIATESPNEQPNQTNDNTNPNSNNSNDNNNTLLNTNDTDNTNSNTNSNTNNNDTNNDIEMTDKSADKCDHKSDKSKSKSPKSKSTKKEKRHRSRYRHKSRSNSHDRSHSHSHDRSRSRSRSHSRSHTPSNHSDSNDSIQSHGSGSGTGSSNRHRSSKRRHRSRSHSPYRSHGHGHGHGHRSRRSHGHRNRKDYHRRSHAHGHGHGHHSRSRRRDTRRYRRPHSSSRRRDRDRDRSRRRDRNRNSNRNRDRDSSHSDGHGNGGGNGSNSNNGVNNGHLKKKKHENSSAGLHGPTMDISVTVFPKSMSGESKVIVLNIARTSTVSDFKGTLCTKGFNVFLQYNLLVDNKELDVEDDRLLCIHVGIKPNECDKNDDQHIMVKPKNGEYDAKNDTNYDPFLADKVDKKKETERADQIEMYKAYEEMFGVEEAAGMMGLDAREVSKLGISVIIDRLDSAKNDKLVGNKTTYDYSEELLFAERAGLHDVGNNKYNENLIDTDTAIGTTHTAGGGTVSRPPPDHVSDSACIFVGDLHPSVTRSDLLSVFSQIGSVQWIQLFDCHAQMNRPFNFSFIYFEDLLCARQAISTLNYTKFYGSPCRLMWKQEKNQCSSGSMWTDCNIIVKNLPPATDSQLLHSVFSKFGKILSSKVKTTSTGRTLPYGYVQYGNKSFAESAILASDRGELSVSGHLLTAEWFKSREDRAFRQIYVKNIPNNWSDTDLLNLFEAQTLGKIKSFTVKHSPYGRWACISFHEPHHAVKAIDKLNNCPTGDSICPNLSVSRFMYKTERSLINIQSPQIPIQTEQPPLPQPPPQSTSQCYSIYVGNVPLQLTDQHMRQLFEPFGAVISAAVVQKTQDYKYGFVNFQQPQDAARALVTMNGKSIGGKTLQVKPANTDMSKAIAITQLQSNNTHSQSHSIQQQKTTTTTTTTAPNITHKQAKEILKTENGNKEKIWKVQYGEDWHEYDTTLAAIVEQLNIGEQIQITLADSNYIITRIQNDQAMQKNCASGTMRKVVRSQRDLH